MEEQWRNLPSDILGLVVQRLDQMSIRYVRAVCSPWRSSAPCPITYLPPIKIPFPVEPTGNERPLPPFVLTRRKLLALSPLEGATSPWIIQVEETGPNKWSLLDPIRSQKKTSFPKNELPDHINLLDYKVIEICQSYDLHSEVKYEILWCPAFRPKEIDSTMADRVLNSGDAGQIFKVVVIVDSSDNSDGGSIECGDYTLFVLFDTAIFGPSSMKLAFWKSRQNCWTSVQINGYSPIEIIDYKGEVYGFDLEGTLLRFDAATCLLVEVATKPMGCICGIGRCYMADFKQHLYLVNYCNTSSDGVSTMVYVLNEENGTWDRAPDLGGGVFFLGYDNVLSISAKEVGLPKEDVVYVEGFSDYINPKTGCEGDCKIMCDLASYSFSIISWWPDRTPFWPPPSWLKEIPS